MTQLQKCIASEKAKFKAANGRDMTPADVPMRRSYERGHAPCDEPPGFDERYYQLWLALGGVVTPAKPVTADDL